MKNLTISKDQWWGYLHVEGTLQAKRYFSQRDLEEAWESPFVERLHGPFDAAGRGEAIAILTKHFKNFMRP